MARPFRGSAEERARLRAAVDAACARHDRALRASAEPDVDHKPAKRLGETGRGGSGFREFVRVIADEIALKREAGLPVTFRASALPTDPGRRASTVALMAALGVAIVEE